MGSSYLFSINDNPSVEIFSGKVLAGKNKTFKKVYFTILYLSEYIFVLPCVYWGIQNLPSYYAQKSTYLGYSYIWTYGASRGRLPDDCHSDRPADRRLLGGNVSGS